MSIFKRITSIAVSFLLLNICWSGVPLDLAYGDSVSTNNTSITAGSSDYLEGTSSEPIKAQQSGEIPDSATVIDINTENRDAIIKADGLYYFSDSSPTTYDKDTTYNGLNPSGYVLRGNTTNTITVEPGVKTTLYLDSVTMTSDRRYKIFGKDDPDENAAYSVHYSEHPSCIKVSHADVTIKIKGENSITINGHPNSFDHRGVGYGCAIEKNGMDGTLVLETVSGENDGGSLNVKAENTHEGALTSAMGSPELGFANLEIRSGKYTFQSGEHSPGIGANCSAYLAWEERDYYAEYLHDETIKNLPPQKTKNITIKKAEVMAIGGECCAGLGSGYGTPVEGIYISDGAKVTAVGGHLSPGIGSGGMNEIGNPSLADALDVKDIVISGGDTVVIAYGDQAAGSKTPGIGCGEEEIPEAYWNDHPKVTYTQALTNVKATALQNYTDPETGVTKSYYGTVQFGESPANLINGSENHSVDGSEHFIGDYAFADFLKSQADASTPVRYVKVFFTPADEIAITKVPDTSGLSEAYKKQLEANAANGSMEGAEFSVYTDAACTQPFILNNNPSVITMSKNGVGSIPVPDGTYYVKETKAPTGFVKSDEVRKVTLSNGSVTWETLSAQSSNGTFKNAPTILKVTFKDAAAHGGAQLGDVQKVPYGCSAVAPSNPTWDDNHTFTGWDKSFNYITEDTVVNATYRTTSSAAKTSSDASAKVATSDTKATASKMKASGSAKTRDALPVLPFALLCIGSLVALFIVRIRTGNES